MIRKPRMQSTNAKTATITETQHTIYAPRLAPGIDSMCLGDMLLMPQSWLDFSVMVRSLHAEPKTHITFASEKLESNASPLATGFGKLIVKSHNIHDLAYSWEKTLKRAITKRENLSGYSERTSLAIALYELFDEIQNPPSGFTEVAAAMREIMGVMKAIGKSRGIEERLESIFYFMPPLEKAIEKLSLAISEADRIFDCISAASPASFHDALEAMLGSEFSSRNQDDMALYDKERKKAAQAERDREAKKSLAVIETKIDAIRERENETIETTTINQTNNYIDRNSGNVAIESSQVIQHSTPHPPADEGKELWIKNIFWGIMRWVGKYFGITQ